MLNYIRSVAFISKIGYNKTIANNGDLTAFFAREGAYEN